MTMPTCGHLGCKRRANVVYRSTTPHPIPRCWNHAPRLTEGIALGWLDPPACDPLTLQLQSATINSPTTTKENST